MCLKLDAAYVWQRLPVRRPESNKGSYGSVTIAAGSAVYRGAAALCTEGALRCGAGLVTLASVEPVLAAVLARLPECCLLPCAESADGGIDAAEAPRILEKAARGSVLLAGPGLGDTAGTAVLTAAFLSQTQVPVVLDADGLNAAARLERQTPGILRPAAAQARILTPHPGEMARLAGSTAAEVQAARLPCAQAFARQHGCIVVLKGHDTVIAAPDGTCALCTAGNAGLARGGSGDVLAGMIAALLAQGLSAFDAACCGVWLHAAAADETARRLGQYGMLPQDLFADLGALFARSGR